VAVTLRQAYLIRLLVVIIIVIITLLVIGAGITETAGTRDFLFATAFRPAPGPTQALIQWVPGPLSLVVKRPGHEVNLYLHLVPRSRIVELYLHSPIRLMAQCLIK
jgi:hypothetical protein